jgi:Protein of unknown function (DUF3800)
MLERTGSDWWLAMIQFENEVYFDDSGTDAQSPIAVAACYVARKAQWDEFVRNYDDLRMLHGFDEFKMSEFVAKPEAGHKPFCDWDNGKKELVYRKIAGTINLRVRHGFAIAVPKKAFDKYTTPEFRANHAADHYVWAVHNVLAAISFWRERYGETTPMQYVFDNGSLAQQQLYNHWNVNAHMYPHREKKYGIVKDGVMFQDSKAFKPLQAADILAWQAQNHMRRTYAVGKNTDTDPHPGFKLLIEGRPMELGYYTEEKMESSIQDMNTIKNQTGKWPWEHEVLAGGPTLFSPDPRA